MKKIWIFIIGAALAAAVVLSGCGNLKYIALKGTSVANPPTALVKVYIKEFPVKSKASLVDPTAAVSSPYDPGARSTGPSTASGLVANTRDIEISRPSRLEDLAGAVLRELRKEKVRVFFDLDRVTDLEEVRDISNPFELVASDSEDAALEISGKALIRSRRVSKQFTQKTDNVEIELIIKDLKTGKVLVKEPMKVGIHLTFNSVELEEAMAVAVVTHLTQRSPF
ncbi:MAG: hypothetical protein HOC74_41475 [Gemmatimonadetes bacterium]|jgi:hypothetical protein|nr:hypothetical protein [Gemmatimonadota bacterium]